jgi:type I restriction enzyme M protein
MAAIRDHIAGNARGITRDDAIVRELVKLLHARTHDELAQRRGRAGRFYRRPGEPAAAVKKRIERLLVEARGSDELLLDADSVAFAVEQLQGVSILTAERDVLGEAFEALIGPSLRGAEGQFFTPRNLVRLCVEMLAPGPDESILDPACGAGGFLGEALRQGGGSRGTVVGIDKDAFLAQLCFDHLALYGQEHRVFCDHSLALPREWSAPLQEAAPLGSFDVVLTNPPFGAAIPVKGTALLTQYDLARRWKRGRGGTAWQQTEELLPSRPPQVLFIERCLQFLRRGGRAALVLPEGLFGNEAEGYVRQWVLQQADLLAVVDCPVETFLPSTPTKTCVLLVQKKDPRRPRPSDHPVFLAIAEHCGHDRRGRPIYHADGSRKDDFPKIAAAYRGTRETPP